jgi:hypothetical protein
LRCIGIKQCNEGQCNPSIFDGETFPDFINSLVERIKSGVKGSVVKVEYVANHQKSENPVVGFHVHENLFDPVTDQNNNVPQNVLAFPARENDIRILQDWLILEDWR